MRLHNKNWMWQHSWTSRILVEPSLIVSVRMITCCGTRGWTPYFTLIHSTVKKVTVHKYFRWCSSLWVTKVLSKYTEWNMRRSLWKLISYFARRWEHPKHLLRIPVHMRKSNEVQTFLNKVGKTRWVLEESTQHSNRSDLYIGLMKTGVGKDMRETNSPILFWWYACEQRAAIMTLLQKYFPIARTESIYGNYGRDGGHIKPMSVWLVWIGVFMSRKVMHLPFSRRS